MTIKTLSFIHALLVREEETTRMVLDSSRQKRREYEEGLEDGTHTQAEYEETERIYEEMHAKHSAAFNALQEFESEDL